MWREGQKGYKWEGMEGGERREKHKGWKKEAIKWVEGKEKGIKKRR